MFREYSIAWDGDPGMDGKPQTIRAGRFTTLSQAMDALRVYIGMGNKGNVRVERRTVTAWQHVLTSLDGPET